MPDSKKFHLQERKSMFVEELRLNSKKQEETNNIKDIKFKIDHQDLGIAHVGIPVISTKDTTL